MEKASRKHKLWIFPVRIGDNSGYVLVFVLGWVLFGIAALRAHIYPRSASMLLVAGTLILIFPLPLSGVIFAGAVAWMGYVLFTGRDEEALRSMRS